MDRDEVDVGVDLFDGRRDGIGPFGSADHHLNSEQREIRAELRFELGFVLGRNDDQDLLHVVAGGKSLGGMHPHRSPVERDERFFQVWVVKPRTLARGGKDHGELSGHGETWL